MLASGWSWLLTGLGLLGLWYLLAPRLAPAAIRRQVCTREPKPSGASEGPSSQAEVDDDAATNEQPRL